MQLTDYLAAITIATAIVGEVEDAKKSLSEGAAFSETTPLPVPLYGKHFILNVGGSPTGTPRPSTPSPLDHYLAIGGIAMAIVQQGSTALQSARAGQAFSISANASAYAHPYNFSISGSPV